MKIALKSWILLISLSIIWGSSFILMKKGMYTASGETIFSSTQVATLRILIAAVVLFPFALKAISQLGSLKNGIFLFFVGLCGNFLPAYLFTFAETGISSGYAGMLNSFTPIFSIILGYLFFQNRLTFIQFIGILVGTVGIVALSISGGLSPSNGGAIHVLAIVFATLCYAISMNFIKYKLSHIKALPLTALAFFCILPLSLVGLFLTNSFAPIWSHPNGSIAFLYILLLAVVGTAFAVILFSQLIAISDTFFASCVTYLIPVVAVCIGVFFEEYINVYQIVSLLLVLLGVFIANVRLRKPPRIH